MVESVVLGIIQGITEWLPISSEGALFLLKTNFFDNGDTVFSIVRLALFLHLGTFLAALVYFRKDVIALTKSLLNYRKSDTESRKTLWFLIISTLISAVLGLLLLKILAGFDGITETGGRVATLFIGILLLITAFLQIKTKGGGLKSSKDLTSKDGIILGLAQGLAVLPGFSRSGFTVSALLLRKFNDTQALRLSFLMSLPAVLGGNVLLNFTGVSFYPGMLIALVFSFIFGLLTVDALLRFAKKVNFGKFVLFFGIITILAASI